MPPQQQPQLLLLTLMLMLLTQMMITQLLPLPLPLATQWLNYKHSFKTCSPTHSVQYKIFNKPYKDQWKTLKPLGDQFLRKLLKMSKIFSRPSPTKLKLLLKPSPQIHKAQLKISKANLLILMKHYLVNYKPLLPPSKEISKTLLKNYNLTHKELSLLLTLPSIMELKPLLLISKTSLLALALKSKNLLKISLKTQKAPLRN